MVFVYFAHLPDQRLLEQSARALKRIYNNPNIIVFWEKGKEGFLEGAQNLVSSFDRNNNLNGFECCEGILNCLLETKSEKVIKIDCDTVLTRPLEEFDGFLFFEATQPFLGVGPCYGIDKKTLEICKQRLVNYIPMAGRKYPEDLSISAFCLGSAVGTLKFYNNGETIQGYDFSKNWEKYKNVPVIHFGNPDPTYDSRIKKARDAAHMKLFLDYIETEV